MSPQLQSLLLHGPHGAQGRSALGRDKGKFALQIIPSIGLMGLSIHSLDILVPGLQTRPGSSSGAGGKVEGQPFTPVLASISGLQSQAGWCCRKGQGVQGHDGCGGSSL